MIAAFLAKPAVKYGLIAAAALALVGGTAWYIDSVYDKGHDAGAADVTNAVQSKTIETQEQSRIEREKTDAEIRSLPYSDRVDGLR